MPEQQPNQIQQRQVAYKAKISDLVNGKYIVNDGWQPNYLELRNGKRISRVNLMGTIISKNPELDFNSLVIDDGTGNVALRLFEGENELLQRFNVGDVVLVIGRPRKFGQETYVVPEIIKPIENKNWVLLRRLELDKEPNENKIRSEKIKPKLKKPESPSKKETDSENISLKAINAIKKIDKGDGADTEEIVKCLNCGDAEDIIVALLREGEIFELRPGKLKVLE